MKEPPPRRQSTLLQHFAEEEIPFGAVTPPLFQNSLFTFETVDAFVDAWANHPGGPPYHYSRLGNPTLDIVERKIAALEGTDGAKVFSGGIGAITLGMLSLVQTGAHMVVVDTCYGVIPTFTEYLERFGVSVTYVDGRSTEAILDAVRPDTALIYLESPGSIIFELQDIEAVCRFAKERGIKTLIDNTYSTPIFQSPAAMGIDIVVHSATKYLGGHSDITAGVLCGSAEFVEGLIRREMTIFGAALAPFPAWLLLRGLRTLKVRVQAHERSGNEVAKWLQGRPEVARVFHTSLPDNPQRDLFLKQMRGSTGLLSFEPKNQDPEAVKRFVDALEMFKIGVSWGGFESLVVPLNHQPKHWPEARHLVRLHCGLEDVEDLIEDLERAFEASVER
ncbi:MAG: PLP-dependent aspartate aminotransferase family protein [Fimbriimonadaceae bacterium]|nr:PLP-dependent aspartate aminotransferase family protein [Fimbriimonadaceae bacterium]